MEKFLLQQAKDLLDHLLDEVPCVLQDVEDLDPIEDYAEVKEEGHYTWEVTNIVRGWYENGNTGMMFKASDELETVNNLYKHFSSSDNGTDDYERIKFTHNKNLPYIPDSNPVRR